MNGTPPCCIMLQQGGRYALKEYNVYCGHQIVGNVTLKEDGLYYRVSCKCSLTNKKMYRLMAACDETKRDLGICLPQGEHFGFEKKIPIKHLGKGDFIFSVIPHGTILPVGQFIPIDSNKPFEAMADLERAYFCLRDGEPGLLIK